MILQAIKSRLRRVVRIVFDGKQSSGLERGDGNDTNDSNC